ncbi:MAG: hypothetical protein ACRDQ5_18105 [Sciscionella sp.]
MVRPVVVVYDVADDARRARVRELLGPVADRFQRSGWLVPSVVGMSAAQVHGMLSSVVEPGDRLRVQAPCPGCRRRARWLPVGQPHSLQRVTGWVVVSGAEGEGGTGAGADQGGADPAP